MDRVRVIIRKIVLVTLTCATLLTITISLLQFTDMSWAWTDGDGRWCVTIESAPAETVPALQWTLWIHASEWDLHFHHNALLHPNDTPKSDLDIPVGPLSVWRSTRNQLGENGKFYPVESQTCYIQIWFMVAILGAYPTFVLARLLCRRWRQRHKPNECKTCGYDLTGNESGVCPECGMTIPKNRVPPSTPNAL